MSDFGNLRLLWARMFKGAQRPFAELIALLYTTTHNVLEEKYIRRARCCIREKSRAEFLHLSFSTNEILDDDVTTIWAIIRAHHPLLAAEVVSAKDGGATPLFRWMNVSTPEEALYRARESLTLGSATKQNLIHTHMNGKRSLSDSQLSHLTIGKALDIDDNQQDTRLQRYHLFITAPHFIGDGISLHKMAQEILILLSDTSSLSSTLNSALAQSSTRLPLGMESRLPKPTSLLQSAAQTVDYQLQQAREIGSHTIPREERGDRRTVIIERSFDQERTKRILGKCKAHGVSISNATFALIAITWARIAGESSDHKLPTLMYTAQNLRSHLPPRPSSYCFLALTYFTISLPFFLPSDLESAFWHRSKSVRTQTIKTISSPHVISRAQCMSNQRASSTLNTPPPFQQIIPPRAPSKALCGLSLVGNLDTIYNPQEYASRIRLNTVTTASRQKAGGFLFLEHTFGGRLWWNLAFDENGFPEDLVQRFWEELRVVFDEVMG